MANGQMNLDTKLRLQLRALRGEWQGIAKHADVSHSWMSQFVRGKIPNPGIQTLRQLAIAIDTLGLANRAARLHRSAHRVAHKPAVAATPEIPEAPAAADPGDPPVSETEQGKP